MIDIKWIRDNPSALDFALKLRGHPSRAEDIIDLDAKHRAFLTQTQDLQSRRNQITEEFGALKRQKMDEADPRIVALKDEIAAIKTNLDRLQEQEREAAQNLQDVLDVLPNLPHQDVPEGLDETRNVEIRRFSEPRAFAYSPKTHFELGEELGLMDFERAAKLSGSRFVVLKGALSRLERALASFMLDVHVFEFGYTEITPPLMVRRETAYGTGNLPKFEEDLFKTNTGHYLIPTAEMPLTNLVSGEILEEAQLPMRMTAYTPCFRAEAGSAGRDTTGMIRQHQFTKVELVSITRPEDSLAEHERMTSAAETILKKLDLPYRVMLLCTGDMGAAAQKTYDIEVWLPSEGRYREISSCSNCGDYQARRMKARFKRLGGKTNEFVHTLNGSGLAVGRTLIAVLENYQQEDGSIIIPDILRPYMGHQHVIKK